MALPSPLPVAGQKRGPGRPPKSAESPVTKKQKRADTNAGDNEMTGASAQEPTVLEEDTLPSRLHKHDRLPTTSQPQSISLSDEDYASIASSGVLSASLEKSKQSWTTDGVFDRYWVKPETGKHAKPPPIGNPDLKSMKGRGRCRLRIEPHIFEVEVWVVEKPKLPAAKQNTQHAWQNQPTNNVKPATQPAAASKTDQKSTSDPVIGMLATRAGSDPELKALMREVAAGKASQDQLKIFQKHIDELSALIQAQKTKEEEEKRKTMQPSSTQALQPVQQPVYAAPSPAEVVFSFTAVGASPDRFLFPRHCILETLTPQHLLASFLITRPAKENGSSTDGETVWIPVTLMIEVAYGREGILKDIRQWVKPADQSREYMKEVIENHKRAPERHLALRLPFKSARSSQSVSHASTPVPVMVEERKKKPRKSVGSNLKEMNVAEAAAKKAGSGKHNQASTPTKISSATATQQTIGDEIKVEPGNSQDADQASNAAGARRSSRATRRSLRASDQ